MKKTGWKKFLVLVMFLSFAATVLNAVQAYAEVTIPTATITVDGNTADWSGINPLVTDPQGDSSPSYTGDDIMALYAAKDASYLYIRMDLWENANTNFGNGPSPDEGRYYFMIDSNSSTYPNLGVGLAYGVCGQWSLGCNGSNGTAPETLQGPGFVGVSGNIIEIKIPLSDIGNPTLFNSIEGEVLNCCVQDFWTLDEIFAGPPDILASPPSLNFGNVNVNTTSPSQTITFYNTGTTDLHVSSGELLGTDASMFAVIGGPTNPCPIPPFTATPGSYCTLSFTFTPTSTGTKTATFRVNSDDPDTPQLDIPLSGYGQQAQQQSYEEGLEVSLTCPASVSYGTGSTNIKVTATIKNWDCSSSVTIKRFMTALVANAQNGGTLGGTQIYGPYPNYFANAKILAQATGCGTGPVTPGTLSLTYIPITTAPNVPGTMAMAYLEFVTSTGESLGGGSCMVEIKP